MRTCGKAISFIEFKGRSDSMRIKRTIYLGTDGRQGRGERGEEDRGAHSAQRQVSQAERVFKVNPNERTAV